jgi:hypothetical protein
MKTFDLTLATDLAVCLADFGESYSKTAIFKNHWRSRASLSCSAKINVAIRLIS